MSTTPLPDRVRSQVVNIAAYKFVPLSGLPALRVRLKQFCSGLESQGLGLKGTIMLSPEGINLFIAGQRATVDALMAEIRSIEGLGELEVKESFSDRQPFNRMLVKIKKEIIAFGVEGIDPITATSPTIAPKQLKQWLDEGRTCTLLDTRNDYEIRLGTFENAQTLPIDHFRQFPEAINALPSQCKSEPVVIFCTGGVRCEKAGPYMQRAGFQEVYQLEGGILKYFEECGQKHYKGECFVFDQRVALDADLQETATTQCYACQSPLTAEEQTSSHYIPGESCPYCYAESSAHVGQNE